MDNINQYVATVLKAFDEQDEETLDKLKAQGNRLTVNYSEVAEVVLNLISTFNLQLDYTQQVSDKKLEILIKSLYDNKLVSKEQFIAMSQSMTKLEQVLEEEIFNNLNQN